MRYLYQQSQQSEKKQAQDCTSRICSSHLINESEFIKHDLAATAAKSLQSCPTLCDPIDGSPPGSWDSPGKNTGVGCHFLLQCMKVKSESEVVQSCLTLSDPMDCNLPGPSIHGVFQARVLEWVLTNIFALLKIHYLVY